jgi:hypothetical protein
MFACPLDKEKQHAEQTDHAAAICVFAARGGLNLIGMGRIARAVIGGLGLALALGGASCAADPSGDWLGAITVGPGVTFDEAVHIEKTPQGGYAGTFDSLDRAAFGIQLGDVAADADTLSFTAATHPTATFKAKWDAASGQWAGQWTRKRPRPA